VEPHAILLRNNSIGGNKVRLITAIHYNRHKVYIRAVLTHEEYDQDRWKE